MLWAPSLLERVLGTTGQVGKSMDPFGTRLQTDGLSQEMLPASGAQEQQNTLLPNSISGRQAQGNTGGATQTSAQILRVVLGENKLLKRVQADVAADGSMAQLSVWHRR